MRHGSAIVEEKTGSNATQELPDAQSLGRRLIAFARIAASMHAEMSTPEPNDTDLALASLLRVHP